ncbi:hypothetical protein [Neotamlana laminarinivorans]|uniref:Uncharacterized protein n=1 Tax=Neotamlana laminarinivorans TaxID=2883124 RepID=A0A9X1L4E4_9FLAO|nr:hypothetical protein [Tamlana laminarinivorans]MCB4798251.1 hypothetical protein [Tamlana laminarinivorans]
MNIANKEQLKKAMIFFNNEDFENYYDLKISILKLIQCNFEGDAKDYYINLINKVDASFNDRNKELISGINNMLENLPHKNSNNDFQLISFCFIASGDYSIRIRAYKNVNENNHEQGLNAIGYGDLGNYYLDDLTKIYNECYYNSFSENYEDDLEDIFILIKHKKMTQVKYLIKECVSKFNLSQLNITYPLYTYLDYGNFPAGSGFLISKIN